MTALYVTQRPESVIRASRVPCLQPPHRRQMMLTLAESAATEAVDMLQALSLACTATMQPVTKLQASEAMMQWERRGSVRCL